MAARPPALMVRGEMFGSFAAHSTGMPILDAQSDFRRARRAHAIARVAGRLKRQRGPVHPPTMDDRTGGLETPRRIEVVPLDSIVGTLEPTVHFDARFRPTSELVRPRWERIALAHRTGHPLPPIDLVKRPDGYYVLDGRHRVSVALALGHPDIEALVREQAQTAGGLVLSASALPAHDPSDRHLGATADRRPLLRDGIDRIKRVRVLRGTVTPCTKRRCSSAPDSLRSEDRWRAASPRRPEHSQGHRRN